MDCSQPKPIVPDLIRDGSAREADRAAPKPEPQPNVPYESPARPGLIPTERMRSATYGVAEVPHAVRRVPMRSAGRHGVDWAGGSACGINGVDGAGRGMVGAARREGVHNHASRRIGMHAYICTIAHMQDRAYMHGAIARSRD